MKIDNENAVSNEREMLYYHFDGTEWQLQWEEKFEISDLEYDNINQELETIRKQIQDEKLSPLAFHIHKNLYGSASALSGKNNSIGLLSSYTGISKRLINKHLKPENFNQLNEDTLKKYADALDISIEELINV
jgi:hypothetical protein